MVDVLAYCGGTARPEVVRAFENRGFKAVKLTGDPRTFWNALHQVKHRESFALFSHGDSDGPCLTAGTESDSLTADDERDLVEKLSKKEILFYCLSCNTHESGLRDRIEANGEIEAYFPVGYCAIETVGQGASAVISIKAVMYDKREHQVKSAWLHIDEGESDTLRSGKALTIK